MVFRSTDNGPYWMTPEEQEQTRKDHFVTTVTTKEHTKPQLIELLRQRGIENAKGSKKHIRNMAERAGISLTYQKQDVLQGWEGKAKGMEQILWERGWIDPSQDRRTYTVNGKKDSMGAFRKDTSLRYLMSNLKDFEGQETMLQLKARRWAYLWIELRNAIVSWLERGLNMHGDAPRIIIEDNL
ncbi:hypothetical protein MHU86_18423 [Fragilaria crotonensis]|nr:hypothetical protein MHU86_18423 [Fragilaria crotonensis]